MFSRRDSSVARIAEFSAPSIVQQIYAYARFVYNDSTNESTVSARPNRGFCVVICSRNGNRPKCRSTTAEDFVLGDKTNRRFRPPSPHWRHWNGCGRSFQLSVLFTYVHKFALFFACFLIVPDPFCPRPPSQRTLYVTYGGVQNPEIAWQNGRWCNR